MTRSEIEALEYWQTASEAVAERKIADLEKTVDDLTDLAKRRASAPTLRANRHRLFESMRKIHDIFLDTQPVATE